MCLGIKLPVGLDGNMPMNKTDKKKHIITIIKLRDLIIAELLGALISGAIAGLVHLVFDTFHLKNDVENICDMLNQKDQASCKKTIESIMNATENNIDDYTVQLK